MARTAVEKYARINIMKIFRDINEARKNLTTYKVGLLQTKAYRNLKSKTSEALKPYKVSSVEWAFLGILHEYKDGIRPKNLADVLGVEAPFITSLAIKFEKQKILEYKKDDLDGRAKKLLLTDKGHNLAIEIEALLRKESKKWLEGISIREIITFIKVLKKLSED